MPSVGSYQERQAERKASEERERQRNQQKFHNRIAAIGLAANVVVALFSIRAVYAALDASEAARDANDLARGQIQLEMRPWVRMKHSITRGPIGTGIDFGWVLQIGQELQNFGRTPAIAVTIASKLVPRREKPIDYDIELEKLCNEQIDRQSSIVQRVSDVFPGGDIVMVFRDLNIWPDELFPNGDIPDEDQLLDVSLLSCLRYQSADGTAMGQTKYAARLWGLPDCDKFPFSEEGENDPALELSWIHGVIRYKEGAEVCLREIPGTRGAE